MAHAPKIQTLNLSGCSLLTDRALESISLLGHNLDVLLLAHVANITDRSMVHCSRSCANLRCVDVACASTPRNFPLQCNLTLYIVCRNLTDMSVFELAGLSSLRRLSLVRVHKLTDIALFALAEHATALERLQVSYCDKLSLDAVHLLLNKLDRLEHLSATGIPSFKRQGVERFSDSPPPVRFKFAQFLLRHAYGTCVSIPFLQDYDTAQQSVFRVFNGTNVTNLKRFLDKEGKRRREAEVKNIPFIPRSDDKLDLY